MELTLSCAPAQSAASSVAANAKRADDKRPPRVIVLPKCLSLTRASPPTGVLEINGCPATLKPNSFVKLFRLSYGILHVWIQLFINSAVKFEANCTVTALPKNSLRHKLFLAI